MDPDFAADVVWFDALVTRRALAGATDDGDASRAHRVAEPWVRRVQLLEHSQVEALEDSFAGSVKTAR